MSETKGLSQAQEEEEEEKKKWQSELIDCVIEISPDGESPYEGINSYLEALKKGICTRTLHIVKTGFSAKRDIPKDMLKSLEEVHKVTIVPHRIFDASKVTKDARAVIFIGADLDVTTVALDQLMKLLDTYNYCYSEFAVSSSLKFAGEDEDKKKPKRPVAKGSAWYWPWLNSPAYGFLLLLLVLDTFRSIITLGKYHRTSDLRVQTLNITYPKRAELRHGSRWYWWFFTGICGIEDGRSEVHQIVDNTCPRHAGWNLVFRTISQHRHMGLGILWITGYLFYYFLISWPWWNYYMAAWIPNRGPWLLLWYIYYRDMWTPLWIGIYLVQLVPVLAIGLLYLGRPFYMVLLYVMLFPFYVMFSPLIFLVGRLKHIRK